MTDILIASVPIHGHVTPLLAAAAGLFARGHHVRFLTGARFEAAVRRTGSTFLTLPAEADYDDRLLEQAAASADTPRPKGLAGLRYDVRNSFFAPARAQYDALLEHLRQPTDAVVTDPTFLGAALLTSHPRHTRPPVVIGGVLPLQLSSADVAPFGLGLQPLLGRAGRSVVGRSRNHLLRFLVERVVFGPVQRDFDALHRSVHGAPAGTFIIDWISAADAIVQFSVPSFEYPRSDAQLPVWFAGPIAQPVDAPLPAWWNELPGRRVVAVTQGTIANGDLGQLVRPTIEALAAEDVLVVVTTGGPAVDVLGPLPDNVRAAAFLPYERLFAHVDAFVTNGGFGGVHYALRAGVPLVVAGASEDKPEVAARAAWSGTGVNLHTGSPRPNAVRKAVRRVLDDPRYREAAGKAAAEISQARGVDALLDAVLDAVRDVEPAPRARG